MLKRRFQKTRTHPTLFMAAIEYERGCPYKATGNVGRFENSRDGSGIVSTTATVGSWLCLENGSGR